jgi:hypothetical protein
MRDGRVLKSSSIIEAMEHHSGTSFSLVCPPPLANAAPLRDECGEIVYFFGAQVDASSFFRKNNDLSAILSKDFALESPPSTDVGRKSFFRRLSEKTKLRQHTPILQAPLSQTPGLEEEVVHDKITTVGEQVTVFRTAYGKVPRHKL